LPTSAVQHTLDVFFPRLLTELTVDFVHSEVSTLSICEHHYSSYMGCSGYVRVSYGHSRMIDWIASNYTQGRGRMGGYMQHKPWICWGSSRPCVLSRLQQRVETDTTTKRTQINAHNNELELISFICVTIARYTPAKFFSMAFRSVGPLPC